MNRACSDLCGGSAAMHIPTANRIPITVIQLGTADHGPKSATWARGLASALQAGAPHRPVPDIA